MNKVGMNEEVRKVTLKGVAIRVENKVGRVIGTLRMSPGGKVGRGPNVTVSGDKILQRT